MKFKALTLTFVSLFSICLMSCNKDTYSDPKECNIVVSDVETVELHTDFQKQFLESDNPDSFIGIHSDELGQEEKSLPNKVKVSYTISSEGVNPKKVSVKVSENNTFADFMSFSGDEKETYIYNLKSGATYYYQVVANYVSEFKSEVKSFTVNGESPRNLYVDGLTNVRDLGGWNIGEGKTFKQGMIYRSSQFNYGGTYNDYVSAPSEEGLKVLLEDLKIKTDIDLRRTAEANEGYDEVNGITSSPLGNSVKYVSAPMTYGNKNIYTQQINRASINLFFNTLGNENNYPVVFHCLRGTDRTGALAYVLGAIVGMNETDLLRDYLFSNFGKIGSVVRESTVRSLFIRGISQSEGDTYQEKAANYLMANSDVTLETINNIKNILVG